MRDDQRKQLEGLSESLTDVVLEECDTKFWPGDGKALDQMTQDERGDRFWCKKNAAATLTLLTKVHSVLDRVQQPAKGFDDADDLDKEINAAMREAENRLKGLTGGKSH